MMRGRDTHDPSRGISARTLRVKVVVEDLIDFGLVVIGDRSIDFFLTPTGYLPR